MINYGSYVYYMQEDFMYSLHKKLLSQNFFTNRELIKRLIRSSSIGPNDTVLEIGAGNGFITGELAAIARRVIAVEVDDRLIQDVPRLKNVVPVNRNILDYSFPETSYKVFSNVPFSITGDIIRTLLQGHNPPIDSYLIVQSEAADKFLTHKKSNTMAAMLYHPWWEVRILHQFCRSDFHPIPRVNSALLQIASRIEPLLNRIDQAAYYDFIAGNFIRDKRAKHIGPNEWLSRFASRSSHSIFTGAYKKLYEDQKKLHKNHRTRIDKNWKRFTR